MTSTAYDTDEPTTMQVNGGRRYVAECTDCDWSKTAEVDIAGLPWAHTTETGHFTRYDVVSRINIVRA